MRRSPDAKVYGPYTVEADVLVGIPDAELDRRSSWSLSLKINGGYAKDPRKGLTTVIDWTGELRMAAEFLGLVLKGREGMPTPTFSRLFGDRGAETP